MVQFFTSNPSEWLISGLALAATAINLLFVIKNPNSKKKYPRAMYALITGYISVIYFLLAVDFVQLGVMSIVMVRVSIIALLVASSYGAISDLETYK